MADTLHLEIATPERLIVQEEATEVYIPAANGMIGILPQHAALLSELGVGELSFVNTQGRRTVFVAGGWVEVLNNDVRVLADRAEDIGEIDTTRAEASLKRAQERLNAPSSAGVDVARAINAMKRAEARIAAARPHR
jgi:F-type H+-transporting ATPase subunit epsilon